MPDAAAEQEQARPRHSRRLIAALYSPDSYGLVLLLILVTYALSVTLTQTWAGSVVLAVQIATVAVTLRVSQAHRSVRVIADAALVIAVVVAVLSLFLNQQFGERLLPTVGGLLYFVAPLSILRHLVRRPTIDQETVLGAIATYLLIGMFFAFVYRSAGANDASAFFGSQGDGTFSQDLFFSFTTLSTTGYGNLVPAGNPGQTFAVAEMLIGQLFLVTAVAKVINAYRPGKWRAGQQESSHGD
jgi:hypothetical protein